MFHRLDGGLGLVGWEKKKPPLTCQLLPNCQSSEHNKDCKARTPPTSQPFIKSRILPQILSLAPREWGFVMSCDFAAKECATSELAAQV